MSETSAECRERAAALRIAFADDPLANVRDRYERAACRWDAMAAVAERAEKGRALRLAAPI